jgi:hypothetical protein
MAQVSVSHPSESDWNNLPSGILTLISDKVFGDLEVETFFNCSQVNKTWKEAFRPRSPSDDTFNEFDALEVHDREWSDREIYCMTKVIKGVKILVIKLTSSNSNIIFSLIAKEMMFLEALYVHGNMSLSDEGWSYIYDMNLHTIDIEVADFTLSGIMHFRHNNLNLNYFSVSSSMNGCKISVEPHSDSDVYLTERIMSRLNLNERGFNIFKFKGFKGNYYSVYHNDYFEDAEEAGDFFSNAPTDDDSDEYDLYDDFGGLRV